MASPWNALASANNKSGGFGPGDAIYLKKGTACSGNLTPTGSGTSTSPIMIDSYGTGVPPIINGGGSAEAAVYLLNVSYWTVQNLEVTNDASLEAQRSGILAEVTDNNTYYGITIKNNNVHNVKGVSTGQSTKQAGIRLQAFWSGFRVWTSPVQDILKMYSSIPITCTM